MKTFKQFCEAIHITKGKSPFGNDRHIFRGIKDGKRFKGEINVKYHDFAQRLHVKDITLHGYKPVAITGRGKGLPDYKENHEKLKNTLGPSHVRKILDHFKKTYPHAKEISGDRVTGIHSKKDGGEVVRIPLKNKEHNDSK